MEKRNPVTQAQKNKQRLEIVKVVHKSKKELIIDAMSPEEVLNGLKDKNIPTYGTHQERVNRLKKAENIAVENNPKKGNVLNEIDAIQKRRDERRKKMEEEKIVKQEKKYENELAGQVCDADFHAMISQFRNKFRAGYQHRSAEDMRICIIVRKRPIFKKEESNGEIDAVTSANPHILVHEPKLRVDGISKYLVNHEFLCDNTFSETETNENIYDFSLKPLCPFILNNGTVTCFAYGQTGSGKTFTMKGLQKMVVDDLFTSAKHTKKQLTFNLSFFEIYGPKCLDLLNNRNKLKVMEDGNNFIQIQGLVERPASTATEIHQLIDYGNSVRTTHATASNEDSSRSHAICHITIREQNKVVGKLLLVDLAGSERAQDCMSNNRQRRIEGAEINKSLLALKECIRALSAGEQHIPYRGSKLTLVLRDSFTGSRNKIVMITCVSPGHSAANHTLNSLRYAERLKERSSSDREPLVPIQNIPEREVEYETAHAEENIAEDNAMALEYADFQLKIEALVEKEEELIVAHVNAIKEDAHILTDEGNLIDLIQGNRGEDYDIEMYVQQLNQLVKQKLKVYNLLQDKLFDFEKLLKDEEKVSDRMTRTFNARNR